MTAIQEAVQDIATRVTATLRAAEALGFEMTTDQAIEDVVDDRIQNAADARTRHGQYARVTSAEEIEAALFAAAVAKDIRSNTSRPSTGPVGDYVRSLLA